ncbi:MAG TPA: potassium transporter Kup [Labilithrix sp.]|nr:potassium transporter Kup [Labilithrix sp.]
MKVAIAALGVVYGDIGTSPLYALRECFAPARGVAINATNVLGVLSLFFWSLTLVIVVKYLTFVLRADNNGEGGILALLALLKRGATLGEAPAPRRGFKLLVLLGLFGAALLYGDGVITPAISVLSAVEGLGVATHVLDPVVVPTTAAILVGLFLLQKHGTNAVGRIFGPATLMWFATLIGTGFPWILRRPEILRALDPRYAVEFFAHNGVHGFLTLGAVVLCITGGEALYADMGHFGRRPIKLAWYTVVFPALLVSYFGQGALYLERGASVQNPFYELVSGWARYPIVAIATVATVVASQALISGAYSLTRQAIQLGYWPRLTVVHTSGATEGQIYMPQVNTALMVSCLALVFGFKSSSALASAYGIAVTGTMAITSILFYAVVREQNRMKPARARGLLALFLVVDLAFFFANVTKIEEGGWFPIAVAGVMFALMTTWKRGREALRAFMAEAAMPLPAFIEDLRANPLHRVPGTGVFMTSNPDGVPAVLLHHVKHTRVLHEHVVLLVVTTKAVPEVAPSERAKITKLGEGVYQLRAQYGFMEHPNVPDVLRRCARGAGFPIGDMQVSYYLGRETLLTTGAAKLAPWRKRLFALMSRNAQSATAFFGIPPNRVVELGTQVQL